MVFPEVRLLIRGAFIARCEVNKVMICTHVLSCMRAIISFLKQLQLAFTCSHAMMIVAFTFGEPRC